MNSKIKNSLSLYWQILKDSVSRFIQEDVLTQSAALSYYMVFSLPPMLVIIFWSSGILYEEAAVREAVFSELGKLIGQDGAIQIMNTLQKLTAAKPTYWSAVVGIGTLLFMASTVFVTIKNTLNKIFEIQIEKSVRQSIIMVLLDRILSIAMLGVIALILIVSMVISTLITAFGELIVEWVGEYMAWVLILDSAILNLVILTLLFAITYRFVPNKRLKWRDSWFGAFFTAVLFVVGKSLIAFFIGNSQVANFYEAAGSLLVLMLWVYYSSAMFYFGAIITHSRSELLNENK